MRPSGSLRSYDEERRRRSNANVGSFAGPLGATSLVGGAFTFGPVRLSIWPTCSDYGGFGDGWAVPDEAGIWTEGSCSELALALDGMDEGDYVLGLSLGSICVGSDASLRVEALVNGASAAVRDFRYGDPEWHIELPAPAADDGELDLTFAIEEPTTPLALGWSADDDRRLGILLRAATLLPADDDAARAGLAREHRRARWAARREGAQRLHIRPGEAVELADLSDYGGFRDGWDFPGRRAIWTRGSRSELALAVDRMGDGDHILALSLGSVCVRSEESLRVRSAGERRERRCARLPLWRSRLAHRAACARTRRRRG